MASDKAEFIFIDESGDPGYPGSNPLYILSAVQMNAAAFNRFRLHLASFRYFHEVTREFKDWGGLLKGNVTPQWRSLMHFLADMTEAGEISATTTWLNKTHYRTGGGPYLYAGADTTRFRHFQVRLLMHRHKSRSPWGDNLDVVLDRWSLNEAQRRNLEDYIKNNYALQPVAAVTTVDSAYVDAVQIADLYTRLARRVVEGTVDDEQRAICARLMELCQIVGGLYCPGGPYRKGP
jgi:Protein of unknown function (DUF3800)